jgi:hypothetical protein
VITESAGPGGDACGFTGDRGAGSSAAPAMIAALSERSVADRVDLCLLALSLTG